MHIRMCSSVKEEWHLQDIWTEGDSYISPKYFICWGYKYVLFGFMDIASVVHIQAV